MDLLVGRERELARLREHLARAGAGRGSLVLLAGEAGVGKTTLARCALRESGLHVLEGGAALRGARLGWAGQTESHRASLGVAYGPLVEVLRAHLRTDGGGEGLVPGAPRRRPGAAAARAATAGSP